MTPTTSDFLQKLQEIFMICKKYAAKIYNFFKDKKNDSKLMIVLALAACGLAVYFLIILLSNLSALRQKIPQLQNLASYDTHVLESNGLTQSVFENMDTLSDLIKENENTQKEISSYRNHLDALQLPYTYLLQYVYLPSLNIWKDPFTQQIDADIMGLEYLQKNPYNDITLLQKRSDFFRNVWDNNESNDITDINIGNIVENESGYFKMPITVSFVANSKRAFLLLVDKLSMTSTRENVALINEFFYYLREEIKKDKAAEIKTLTTKYSALTGFMTTWSMADKVIAYHLYNRIFNDQANVLVDKKIIDQTVKSSIVCNNQSDELCYYQFREKYRNIPTFGYLIGTDFATDPAKNLKTFIKNLPPIFSINEFTFDKLKSQIFTNAQNAKYNGKVTIQVYGRGMLPSEISAIASILWSKCFSEDKSLSVEDSLQTVTSAITKLSDLTRIDKAQSDDLRQLKANLEKIQKEYTNLSPYKKTVRLFETYRMLDEAWLCK